MNINESFSSPIDSDINGCLYMTHLIDDNTPI